MAKQSDKFLKYLESKGDLPKNEDDPQSDSESFNSPQMSDDVFQDMQNYFMDKDNSEGSDERQDSDVESYFSGGIVAPDYGEQDEVETDDDEDFVPAGESAPQKFSRGGLVKKDMKHFADALMKRGMK